jgi:hypothetical protein
MVQESGDLTAPKRNIFENIESICKGFGMLLVPIAIAGFGWMIQSSIAQQSVSKDYVNLAIQILQKPENATKDPGLKRWAVALLNKTAPVELDQSTGDRLASGELSLTEATEDPFRTSSLPDMDEKPKIWNGPGGREAALFRDGTFVVINEVSGINSQGKVFGKLQYNFGTPVVDVAFSTGKPNRVLVADGGNRVHLIDQSVETRTVVYEATDAIDKIQFAANDTQVTIRTKEGEHTIVLP